DIWLSEEERHAKKSKVRLHKEADRDWRETLEQRIVEDIKHSPDYSDDASRNLPNLIPAVSDSESDSDSDDESLSFGNNNNNNAAPPLAPEGVNIIPPEGDDELPLNQDPHIDPPDEPPDILPPQPHRSCRLRQGDYRQGLRGLERHGGFTTEQRHQYSLTLGPKQPPTPTRKSRRRRQYAKRPQQRKDEHTAYTLSTLEWNVPTVESLLRSPLARFIGFSASKIGYAGTLDNLMCSWIHPLMLQAKAATSKEDNPNWWQAMNGPFCEEYWKAACVEVETLKEMDTCEVVDREENMNVLPSTWAFKCKRFPDRLIKKFKAQFCAHGDKQIEGVDYFETFAPVVQ
ncbi:hypothetical protein ACHAXS_000127, partial [Conticribra weissflogii]